jgi:hypothetical protein
LPFPHNENAAKCYAMAYVLSAHAETIIREREIAPEWLDAAI